MVASSLEEYDIFNICAHLELHEARSELLSSVLALVDLLINELKCRCDISVLDNIYNFTEYLL